jgi:catechol 2,3-dioxygenase-like lactoylglutathione lyase family enzyme
MTVTAVRHTGIVVRDIERALRFYRDLLGLKVWADFIDDSDYLARITQVPQARVRMIKLRAPDSISIELLQYLTPAPPSNGESIAHPPSDTLGCSHVALQVQDLDSVFERFSAAGVEFHSPPLVSPDGGAKVTYCRDPEGVIIELVEIMPKPSSHLTSTGATTCE